MVEHKVERKKDIYIGIPGILSEFEIANNQGQVSIYYYSNHKEEYKTTLVVQWIEPGEAKPRGEFIGRFEDKSFYITKNESWPINPLPLLKDYYKERINDDEKEL